MPIPAKPCDGKLSDETIQLLKKNRDHAQWGNHLCETCGRMVGVETLMGKWIPERHWPSVSLKRAPKQSDEWTQNAV
jgi:hypothetical protein